MVTKTDLKSLLKQGLTGWEIGKLVFMDSWEVDHSREGILSEKEIATLKNSLKSRKDIDDYNSLIGLYQVTDFINKQILTASALAALHMERVWGIGNLYFGDYLTNSLLRNVPLLVTEKQLQALKNKIKKRRSRKLICLSEVLCERAFRLSPKESREKYGRWEWIEEEPDEFDHYMDLAEEEIYGLINSGKLKPKKLKTRADDDSLEEDGDISPWELTGENTPEQQENMLQNYFTVEQLCKAGLPEWIEYREEFYPWMLDKEDWQGRDMMPFDIAVIQDPSAWQVDKRGYYKSDLLTGVPRLANARERAGITPETDPLMDAVEHLAKEAREELEYIAVRMQVLQDLSKVVGFDLTEDIARVTDAVLEPSLSRYNFYARDLSPEVEKWLRDTNRPMAKWLKATADEEFEELVKRPPGERYTAGYNPDFARIFRQLPTIKLEKIKPPAKDLKEVRSWVSARLGDGWWKPSPAMAEEEEE